MTPSKLSLFTAAFLSLTSSFALAQGTAPTAPQTPAKPAVMTPAAPAAMKAATPDKVAKKVNLNTATAEELDALPQIGEKRSEAIIKGRPYKATEELVSKNVLTQGTFDKIKDQVSVK